MKLSDTIESVLKSKDENRVLSIDARPVGLRSD